MSHLFIDGCTKRKSTTARFSIWHRTTRCLEVVSLNFVMLTILTDFVVVFLIIYIRIPVYCPQIDHDRLLLNPYPLTILKIYFNLILNSVSCGVEKSVAK
jgi:hypothetical protein